MQSLRKRYLEMLRSDKSEGRKDSMRQIARELILRQIGTDPTTDLIYDASVLEPTPSIHEVKESYYNAVIYAAVDTMEDIIMEVPADPWTWALTYSEERERIIEERAQSILSGHYYSPSNNPVQDPVEPSMPWKKLVDQGWAIVGMNHYNMKGKRHLFVAMTRSGCPAIIAEDDDEHKVFVKLEKSAECYLPQEEQK